jgi:anthraniloyl-CoA monooxygenase
MRPNMRRPGSGWSDFVHAETTAKLCCQIGHSGRKGSNQRRLGRPDGRAFARGQLADCMAASAIPYKRANAAPKAMTGRIWTRVKAQFVASTEMAARTGAST